MQRHQAIFLPKVLLPCLLMSCGAPPANKETLVQKNDTSTVIRMIDTCTSISGIKHTGSLSEEAIRLSDSLFRAAVAFQKRLPEKCHVSQKIDYGPTAKINLHFYFTVEKIEEKQLLNDINWLLSTQLEPGWKGKHFSGPDSVVAKRFTHSLRIFFQLDSVQVQSPFQSFNSIFAGYLMEKLMVYHSVAELQMDTAMNFEVLRCAIMYANDDQEKDLLLIDVANEQIANAITDFWLFDKRSKELVWVKELSRPIWAIDKQKRQFTTGWHSSPSREIKRFKIVGTKPVVLERSTY